MFVRELPALHLRFGRLCVFVAINSAGHGAEVVAELVIVTFKGIHPALFGRKQQFRRFNYFEYLEGERLATILPPSRLKSWALMDS
jgi:hypothetical protein